MLSIPKSLNPKIINKVVTIQVFQRVRENSDELIPETLEKYVGALRAYAYRDGKLNIMVGMLPTLSVDLRYAHLEVF